MSESTKKQQDFADGLFHIAQFLYTMFEEIYLGLTESRVPVGQCLIGMMIAAVFYFEYDISILQMFHSHYEIPYRLRKFLIYFFILSGWIEYGVIEAVKRYRLLSRLKEAFESAGLKCLNRYPALIRDTAIDEHVRKLRLYCNGVTKKEFDDGAGKLESMLNITIVRVLQDDGDKNKIDLLYTTKDLTTKAILENPERYADGDIPIGISYEGPIVINMRDVAHILATGQTGGGKSNFQKLAAKILAENNPDAEIEFLDFKGGMESVALKNQLRLLSTDNVNFYDGSANSIEELIRLGGELDQRLSHFMAVGATTFDDYKKRTLKGTEPTTNVKHSNEFHRRYIIIDEIAQLYSREPGIDRKKADEAKASLNRIARQGRAAGVHIIASTQKPDASAFDQTVKANMPGVLCFPMVNQAASVSALGTKRAYELNPDIKGRAIWKFGPKLQEVQTYLFG